MVWHHPDLCSLLRQGIPVVLLHMFLFSLNVWGQNDPDTVARAEQAPGPIEKDTIITREHSPHRATIYSMVLPGLGQAYNKKYWKVPIVYAGFGVMYYFIQFNNKEYQLFKDAYNHSILITDDSEPPVNRYEELYDSDFLRTARNYYRRNRDLSYILTGVWYILNVIDATVDAHLFTWEVDEDLTLRLEPDIIHSSMSGFQPAGGIRLTLKF
jgi:hypothetical protein